MLDTHYLDAEAKKRRLYGLVAVAVPLAVLTVLVAWAQGELVQANQLNVLVVVKVIVLGVVSVVWSYLALSLAQRLPRQQEIEVTDSNAGKPAKHIRWNRFGVKFCLIVLIFYTIFFVFDVVRGSHPYSILLNLWFIIVNGSEFVYVRVLTSEYLFK